MALPCHATPALAPSAASTGIPHLVTSNSAPSIATVPLASPSTSSTRPLASPAFFAERFDLTPSVSEINSWNFPTRQASNSAELRTGASTSGELDRTGEKEGMGSKRMSLRPPMGREGGRSVSDSAVRRVETKVVVRAEGISEGKRLMMGLRRWSERDSASVQTRGGKENAMVVTEGGRKKSSGKKGRTITAPPTVVIQASGPTLPLVDEPESFIAPSSLLAALPTNSPRKHERFPDRSGSASSISSSSSSTKPHEGGSFNFSELEPSTTGETTTSFSLSHSGSSPAKERNALVALEIQDVEKVEGKKRWSDIFRRTGSKKQLTPLPAFVPRSQDRSSFIETGLLSLHVVAPVDQAESGDEGGKEETPVISPPASDSTVLSKISERTEGGSVFV